MQSSEGFTIPYLLETQAKLYGDHPAILAPDRRGLTYSQLWDQVQYTLETLNRAGISRNDRVALIAPDGPETAVATFGIVSAATRVYVKPTLRQEELEQFFAATHVGTLIVQPDAEPIARAAAQACGMTIIELIPHLSGEAGTFGLDVPTSKQPAQNGGFASPDDIAWINLSSGTTSKPKSMLITQRNVYYRSYGRIEIHHINKNDRFMSLTPLYFSSALTAILRILAVGGVAYCPPSFDASRFFEHLEAFKPTYCSAPAAMYQTILAHASRHQDVLANHSLRFLRAGSMPLSPELKEALESVMRIPVIQGYGSGETGSIANNPLPPKPNKPGSVGILTQGKEVRIIDSAGNVVPVGVAGEITVRGPSVTIGYDNDPDANAAAFLGDWFRTGDLGYLDDEGYLYISGRIKEMINKGGVKVSPVEVENVLMKHPAVAEAAVFAIPDRRSVEEVGAAVILNRDQTVEEKELRTFVTQHLADFKVPRRVVFVESLPRTEMGKLKRTGLAEALGLTAQLDDPTPETPFAAPRSTIETQLAAIWADILGRDSKTVSIHAEFIELGGDSLAATRLISRIRKQLHIEITLLDFFDAPTVAKQATIIEKLLI